MANRPRKTPQAEIDVTSIWTYIADDRIKAEIGQTLPRNDLASVREALLTMLTVLENDLTPLSNGQLNLTATQREIIATIRATLAKDEL